jgi:hypothetical protein
MRRPLAVLALVVAVAAAMPVLVAFAWWLPAPPDTARSTGTNALWLRHSWVGDPHSPADYVALAGLLHDNRISDAFFHTGPLDGDGRIPALRYSHAGALLAALHRSAPGVRLQAYVGQVLAGVGGPLDLRSATVRDRVVDSARALLDRGFDGIHYDIEPVPAGDPGFLDLPHRTHELTRARGAVLSVSIQKVAPSGASSAVAAAVADVAHRWPLTTPDYLRAVAAQVDQVAVMVYDTPLPTDSLVGAVYAWQTAHVLRMIGDRTTVFIGVPTYEQGPHLSGEDLRTAIRGAQRGLAGLRPPPSSPHGLAVFAEWTTTSREWAIWRQEWLSPPV